MHFERLHISIAEWEEKTKNFPDRTIYQSAAWLKFLEATQRGKPVFAVLQDGYAAVGYFCGMIVRKFGIPILGSPMAGWTTQYMGFNLVDGVPRQLALEALARFAFRDLGCVHIEMMDRNLTQEHGRSLDFHSTTYAGFEIDLTSDENTLLARMHDSCRRNIRKAGRSGVVARQSYDENFVNSYYAQLQEIFAKQGLVPTYPKERVRQLLRCLEHEKQVMALEALDPDGRSIATMITIGMNDMASFWGGASWREFQILRPNQLLMWTSMLHWKARGIRRFDFGGAGDYKRRYGPKEISVPWLRRSKYPALESLRGTAATLFRLRQRFAGMLLPHAGPSGTERQPAEAA